MVTSTTMSSWLGNPRDDARLSAGDLALHPEFSQSGRRTDTTARPDSAGSTAACAQGSTAARATGALSAAPVAQQPVLVGEGDDCYRRLLWPERFARDVDLEREYGWAADGSCSGGPGFVLRFCHSAEVAGAEPRLCGTCGETELDHG